MINSLWSGPICTVDKVPAIVGGVDEVPGVKGDVDKALAVEEGVDKVLVMGKGVDAVLVEKEVLVVEGDVGRVLAREVIKKH